MTKKIKMNNETEMYWELYENRKPTDEDKLNSVSCLVFDNLYFPTLSSDPGIYSYYLRNASKLKDLPVAKPKPKEKTVEEWLKTLPDGVWERVLKRMRECSWKNERLHCSDLPDAICYGFCWHRTPEGSYYWKKLAGWARNLESGSCPQPPSLYGYTDEGDKIEPEPGYEIIPKGEKIPKNYRLFGVSKKWITGSNAFTGDFAKRGKYIHAYARPIEPQPEIFVNERTGERFEMRKVK